MNRNNYFLILIEIDTFNTIRGCMMDSSDESNDDEIKNPY